jgi:hypothetical protein
VKDARTDQTMTNKCTCYLIDVQMERNDVEKYDDIYRRKRFQGYSDRYKSYIVVKVSQWATHAASDIP